MHDPDNDIAWPAVYIVGADGNIAWRSFEDTYKERVPIEEILAGIAAATKP